MPQISSGQSASLVLNPGESYTISATGVATVKGIYGAPAITTTLNSNFAVFGPYGVPAKLDIACTSGSASYTLDQYEGDVVRSKSNPFTGGSRSIAIANPATYIPFGDSRVANGVGDAGANCVSLSRGFWTHLESMLMGRITCLRSAGVSGNTTAMMLARVQSDVIAYAPGWCFLLGPLNDINLGLDIDAPGGAKENVKAIYRTCAAAGIRFATSTISPSTAFNTASKKQQHSAYNNWVKAWAAANGIPCADGFPLTADAATGLPITNSMYDGIHFTDFGSALEAKAWFDVLDSAIPKNNFLSSMALDYDNLLFGNAGALPTGALPAGWTAYTANAGTPTTSVVARTDGAQGTLLQITGTAVAQGAYIGVQGPQQKTRGAWAATTAIAVNYRTLANDGNQYVCTTPGTTGAAQPTWSSAVGSTTTDGSVVWTRVNNFLNGDLVYAEVEWFVASVSGGNGGFCFTAILQGGGSNVAEVRLLHPTDFATKVPNPALLSGVARSRPFAFTDTTAGYTPFLYARMDNGVTGTLQIGRVAIKHVQSL